MAHEDSGEPSADSAPVVTPTFYQFAFYTLVEQGNIRGMQQIGVGIGSGKVPPPELVNLVHQQLVKQLGLGTARPTHFTSAEIKDLPAVEAPEEAPKRPAIFVPRNGNNGASS